ncbi:MAG: hypothetical protein KDC92_14365, partial [Bacteroidetes bacterium]|nr:hypothetical protein [Bacteroidota bacterium]
DREVVRSRTIHVRSDSITIKVWDNGKVVDGDSISLNLNGNWVLKDFRLKREQHTITLKIDRKTDNYLVMYALNLGTSPPNTAAIVVNDGRKNYVMRIESDMGTCGAINIVHR